MEKKQISVSQVLGLLNEGKDRKAIKEELGLSVAEMSTLFQHPKLKNQKPKRPISFVLIDDTKEVVEEKVETPVITNKEEIAVIPEPVTQEPSIEVKEGVW